MEELLKKYNIQCDIKMLLGRNCEFEKVVKYLKGKGVFEEILNNR